MTTYFLNKPDKAVTGTIDLAGSKSISNRALIIRALCPEPFEIRRLADANDTRLLAALLDSDAVERDAGPAGTTFRFLTAYLALQPGEQVLTGTERMKQRPIGVLVETLRALGARIDYLEKEGYPPLRIGEPSGFGRVSRLSISAGTSSQFISALLMIAPVLPGGLTLELEGRIVSRSYIEMTLNQMAYFGIHYTWEGHTIRIEPQTYQPRTFTVEADWSAASYYYALAAFAGPLDLQLDGLFANSIQGDSALVEMMEYFGVRTEFNNSGVRLTKNGKALPAFFEWDFILCPDIAQTLAVICGGLGVTGIFTGLETLRIKETDRLAALRDELAKVMVDFHPYSGKPNAPGECWTVEGKAAWKDRPVFDTYEDHRMAMAFAPLALLGPVAIREPMVVVKSYPGFYADFERLGFEVSR